MFKQKINVLFQIFIKRYYYVILIGIFRKLKLFFIALTNVIGIILHHLAAITNFFNVPYALLFERIKKLFCSMYCKKKSDFFSVSALSVMKVDKLRENSFSPF